MQFMTFWLFIFENHFFLIILDIEKNSFLYVLLTRTNIFISNYTEFLLQKIKLYGSPS